MNENSETVALCCANVSSELKTVQRFACALW